MSFDASVTHKPQPMHYGICPSCSHKRICVLLTPRDKKTTIRKYYLRTHKCGSRIVPVAGSLRVIESGKLLAHSDGSKS